MKWLSMVLVFCALCACRDARACGSGYDAKIVSLTLRSEDSFTFHMLFTNCEKRIITFSGRKDKYGFELVRPYFILQQKKSREWEDTLPTLGSYQEPMGRNTVGPDMSVVLRIDISRNKFVDTRTMYRFNFCDSMHKCDYYSSAFNLNDLKILKKLH